MNRRDGQPQQHKGKIGRDLFRRRIVFTLALLNQGFIKHQIKGELRSEYGVSARTAERYLQNARAALIRRTGETREFHRALSLATYESIIQDPESTRRERLVAQAQIDKLLGLIMPEPRRIVDRATQCHLKGA